MTEWYYKMVTMDVESQVPASAQNENFALNLEIKPNAASAI